MQNDKKDDKPDTGPTVKVSIDGVEKEIHRGNYKIPELKKVLGVDESKLLAIAEPGQPLRELADSDHFVIKGGEIFFPRVRAGGSS